MLLLLNVSMTPRVAPVNGLAVHRRGHLSFVGAADKQRVAVQERICGEAEAHVKTDDEAVRRVLAQLLISHIDISSEPFFRLPMRRLQIFISGEASEVMAIVTLRFYRKGCSP